MEWFKRRGAAQDAESEWKAPTNAEKERDTWTEAKEGAKGEYRALLDGDPSTFITRAQARVQELVLSAKTRPLGAELSSLVMDHKGEGLPEQAGDTDTEEVEQAPPLAA